ncbi:hypothetical protein ACQV2C_03915 [Pantoea allii]|uniref:hypothetical protein n=1 Tax=Pantoea allii TaxID=574096 RepID=UPI003D316A66
MIEWKVFLNSLEEKTCFELVGGEKIQLKETDNLVFFVKMEAEELASKGAPKIILGDIPLTMVINENSIFKGYEFISNESIESHKSMYFYNFFGQSEVSLYFDNDFDSSTNVTFDILARKDNANLANEMLTFLTENIEDAVAICFSRSKKGAGLSGDNGHNFNKIDAIEKAICFFGDSVNKFLRDRKSIIKNEMVLSENGQPTGPDSVHWALTNLDKLTPANQDDVNLYFNNRGYHYNSLPKEISCNDYDIYENRVINYFFSVAENFLYRLKDQFDFVSSVDEHNIENSEYIRFDHTMSKFSKMALEVKVREIETLIVKIANLRSLYLKIIPSKTNKVTLPRMTSFASRKHHYRDAFYLIDMCYKAEAPNFSKNNLLLGLKNLAIIYELSTLIMLHRSLTRVFNAEILSQKYRQHSAVNPFGGTDVERPEGFINNHFVFDSKEYVIELFYEAKIYPYNQNSRPGDLIDTSNKNSSSAYGKHHFCPDFVLKLSSKKWGKTFTAILDSKYKGINGVKDYDIEPLTNKYLLNIHAVSDEGRLKMSPVDILIILFAHNKKGNLIRRVAPRHCLTGQFPVFPQATAFALNPSETSLLDEHLACMKSVLSGRV